MTNISTASCYPDREVYTYPDGLVLKALGEGLPDRLMMLFLDDARRGVEDAEGGFPLARILGYAQLEEHGEQLRPRLVCTLFSKPDGQHTPGATEMDTYSHLNIAFQPLRRCR